MSNPDKILNYSPHPSRKNFFLLAGNIILCLCPLPLAGFIILALNLFRHSQNTILTLTFFGGLLLGLFAFLLSFVRRQQAWIRVALFYTGLLTMFIAWFSPSLVRG